MSWKKMRFARNTISLWYPLGGNVICSLAGRSTVSDPGWPGPSERDLSKKSMLGCDIKVLRPCGCIHGRIIQELSMKVGSLLMKLCKSHIWIKKKKTFLNVGVIELSHRKCVRSSLQTLPGWVEAHVIAHKYLCFCFVFMASGINV